MLLPINFKRAFKCLLLCSFLLIAYKAPAQQISSYEYSTGVAYFEEGDYRSAIPYLENAINQYPANIDAYMYLASAHLGVGEYQKTIEIANKGLVRAPNHIRLKLILAEGYYRTDYKQAITTYQETEQLLSENPDKENEGVSRDHVRNFIGTIYLKQANELYSEGETDLAIDNYYKAREFSPDSLTIHNNLAYILIEENEWNDALEVLEQANDSFPEAEQILVLLGQVYQHKEQGEKMTEVYRKLTENHPENLNYAIVYGQLLMSINQARKANVFFRDLISKYPKEKRLYDVLININEKRYDYGAKRNILKMQREQFPEDYSVAEKLAETHVLIEEYEEARSLYDSLATETNQSRYKKLAARTWLYEENYESAAEAYRSLVEFSETPENLHESAKVLNEIDDTDTAIKFLKQSDSQVPSPEKKILLVDILLKMNQFDESISYLEKLLESDYSGFAQYQLLKNQKTLYNTNELQSNLESSLIDLVKLFSDLQESYKKQLSSSIESNTLSLPILLQDRTILKRIESTIDNAFLFLKSNFNFDDSMKMIDSVISQYPESPRFYYYKGMLSFDSDQLSVAKDSFEKALQKGAENPELFSMLGIIHTEEGNIDQAILSYERAITTDPMYKRAYSQLISVSQEHGRLNELCSRWLNRFKTDKRNELLKEHLVEALHKADRFDEARQILSQ